jgi:predicted alpha/beta-fold hydrolase
LIFGFTGSHRFYFGRPVSGTILFLVGVLYDFLDAQFSDQRTDPDARRPMSAVFVCAHGAGGHKDDRGMMQLDKALRSRGFEVVRFNFPYREAQSRRPDPMPVLKES